MCIVIDPGCISLVFDTTTRRHAEFLPVRDWVTTGNGRMVIGGTTYKNQLARLGRFLRLFAELHKAGRILVVEDDDVDLAQRQLENRKKDRNFDDAHLIAIAIVAKVMLICTQDRKSCRFIKDKNLYPKGFPRPKIYSGRRNKSLITDKYITQSCRQ